jgi:predicted MPP superfamily phosphohydrolase
LRPPHFINFAVCVPVVLGQLQLAWFLRRHWANRLPGPLRTAIGILLFTMMAFTFTGVGIDLLGLQYDSQFIPPLLCYFFVGVGIVWGFSSLVAANIYAILGCIPRSPAYSPARRAALRTVTAGAIVSPFVLSGFGALIERTAFEVKEIDFPIPNLHPDLEGLRIAQISDLHVSPFLTIRDLARVVDMTNELRPRLTLVTGDLITQQGDPLDAAIRELARLRAEAGLLGCLGNHEIYAHSEDYTTSESAKIGLDFLRMRAVPLKWGNGVLNVAGVDFQSFTNRAHYLPGAENLVLPGAANLLLSHNPDVFPAAIRAGYDAMVGGHTHGGQVTVEILNQTANIARFATPWVAGLYRRQNRTCYVNSGIGTIGMPVRLGAPPEITLLRLRRA